MNSGKARLPQQFFLGQAESIHGKISQTGEKSDPRQPRQARRGTRGEFSDLLSFATLLVL